MEQEWWKELGPWVSRLPDGTIHFSARVAEETPLPGEETPSKKAKPASPQRDILREPPPTPDSLRPTPQAQEEEEEASLQLFDSDEPEVEVVSAAPLSGPTPAERAEAFINKYGGGRAELLERFRRSLKRSPQSKAPQVVLDGLYKWLTTQWYVAYDFDPPLASIDFSVRVKDWGDWKSVLPDVPLRVPLQGPSPPFMDQIPSEDAFVEQAVEDATTQTDDQLRAQYRKAVPFLRKLLQAWADARISLADELNKEFGGDIGSTMVADVYHNFILHHGEGYFLPAITKAIFSFDDVAQAQLTELLRRLIIAVRPATRVQSAPVPKSPQGAPAVSSGTLANMSREQFFAPNGPWLQGTTDVLGVFPRGHSDEVLERRLDFYFDQFGGRERVFNIMRTQSRLGVQEPAKLEEVIQHTLRDLKEFFDEHISENHSPDWTHWWRVGWRAEYAGIWSFAMIRPK